jgi:hypothetical protein
LWYPLFMALFSSFSCCYFICILPSWRVCWCCCRRTKGELLSR